MDERLRLIVDATTGNAEASFAKLTGAARDTSAASKDAARSVSAAADVVAQARAREADAAGKLTVAEAKLEEVRARYGAGSSQVVAAEERVAAAQRQVQLAASGTTTALEAQTVAQQRATIAAEESAAANVRSSVSVDSTGRVTGRLRGQVEELRGSMLALVAGVSLADWLGESVTGFLEGARGANALAQSMNATTAQGGQLSQLFASLGLESDDLLEIQAEFAQKTAANADALSAFGAELKTNDDGTTNWALSLEDALVNLQKIPDATERNRTGFALFGEEGYKQLSRLMNSGMSVQDALDRIGTPFTDEDVALAQQYDQDMMRLSLTSSDLGRTIAREAVPAIADLASFANVFITAITAIPLPVTLALAAITALRVTGIDPLAKGSELVRNGLDTVRLKMMEAADGAEASGGRMARGFSVGRAGLKGLVDMAGGPLGVALIGASVVLSLAAEGAEQLETHAREAAAEVERLGGTSNDEAANTRRLAQQIADQAGAWETFAASVKGSHAAREELTGWRSALADFSGAFNVGTQAGVTEALTGESTAARGFEEAIKEAREELGEFGAQQEAASLTSKSLSDLIAEGTTSGSEFAGAVRDAAEAQSAQETTSGLAEAAIAAYNAVTRDAVTATYDFINARYASEDANFAFAQALDQANSTTDDATTTLDEARQAQVQLIESALRAGQASADAAVANAKASGQIVDTAAEARIRADSMIGDLTAKLNTPGLAQGAREELQGLIDRLTEARDKGDVNALVTLTGVDEAKGELDSTTGDRETHVNVESRGGPAVVDYLDRITNAPRLALIRVESRNGPAVRDYLDGLAAERLAIIRVETRGGPAVRDYLDNLAADREVRLNVTGAPGSGTGVYGAPAVAGMAGGRATIGSVTLDLELRGSIDKGQLSRAQRGRAAIEDIRAYERENGKGWRG